MLLSQDSDDPVKKNVNQNLPFVSILKHPFYHRM